MVSPCTLRRVVSLGVALAGLIFASFQKEYFLYFHVLFMTIFAISPLLEMVELVFSRLHTNKKASREHFVKRHQLLSFFMQVTAGLGFAAIGYKKIKEGKPHLTSPHAVWGSVCGALMLLEAIIGTQLLYIVPKHSAFRKPLRLLHRCLFFLLLICCAVAFGSGWLCTGGAMAVVPNFAARVSLGLFFFLFLYYFFLKPYLRARAV